MSYLDWCGTICLYGLTTIGTLIVIGAVLWCIGWAGLMLWEVLMAILDELW